MMLPSIVSDAGPLIHLAQIGKLSILRKLFCTVLISQQVKIEVYDEDLKLDCVDAEAVGIALKEGWIKIEATPKRLIESAKKLSRNENISWTDAETLLLAVHKKAELLVDERMLSNLAKMYGLHTYNTWTLLLEGLAKRQLELYEIKEAVDVLALKKFALNAQQRQELLDSAKLIHKRQQE